MEKWVERYGIERKFELLDRVEAMGVEDVEGVRGVLKEGVAREEIGRVEGEIKKAESRLIIKERELKELVGKLGKKEGL